jgi:hypothetical protein
VLFLTDAFGLQLQNNLNLCDRYAAAGFTVLCPNIFLGEGLSTGVSDLMVKPTPGLLDKVGFFFGVLGHMPSAIGFMSRNNEAVVQPRVQVTSSPSASHCRLPHTDIWWLSAGSCDGAEDDVWRPLHSGNRLLYVAMLGSQHMMFTY